MRSIILLSAVLVGVLVASALAQDTPPQQQPSSGFNPFTSILNGIRNRFGRSRSDSQAPGQSSDAEVEDGGLQAPQVDPTFTRQLDMQTNQEEPEPDQSLDESSQQDQKSADKKDGEKKRVPPHHGPPHHGPPHHGPPHHGPPHHGPPHPPHHHPHPPRHHHNHGPGPKKDDGQDQRSGNFTEQAMEQRRKRQGSGNFTEQALEQQGSGNFTEQALRPEEIVELVRRQVDARVQEIQEELEIQIQQQVQQQVQNAIQRGSQTQLQQPEPQQQQQPVIYSQPIRDPTPEASSSQEQMNSKPAVLN